MDVFSNFEKQLKLISKFNGVCFNIEEKIKLEIGLKELMAKEMNPELKLKEWEMEKAKKAKAAEGAPAEGQEGEPKPENPEGQGEEKKEEEKKEEDKPQIDMEKLEKLYFWGKINGEESDYYIAVGINFQGHYEFPKKRFYYATQDFIFHDLPETFEYHDKDINDNYYKPLKGKPNEILKKYKTDAAEGEAAEPPPQEENKEGEQPPKIQDPDASVDDNAPIPEPPKENFTELLKLSYLVRQIDYDTSIVPEGALKLAPEHEIRINRAFRGVTKEDIGKMERWMHFRPVSEEKKKMLEEDTAVFRFDIFDSIVNDSVKGSWSLQVDSSKSSCNVRSLLWPGYFASMQGNTGLYCGIYCGNAMKNLELPFMI
ncbi:MAG: hypothetical protein MJ252_16260 [archaeon]|nr:hypothetical protein [archaeon]